MPENKVETIHCGFCGGSFPLDEYVNEHWDKCEKRLAHPSYQKVKSPLKIVTNREEEVEEFLARIDEEEIKVPRRDKGPAAPVIRNPGNLGEEPGEAPVEEPEDRTFLIRDRVLVESNGKVEEPSETVKELPEKEAVEESSEESPIEDAGE